MTETQRSLRLAWLFALLFVAAAPRPARAVEASPTAGTPEEADTGGKKRKKKPPRAAKQPKAQKETESPFGNVKLGGRVFARAALVRRHETVTDAQGVASEQAIDAFDLSLPSVRLEARYRAPAPARWLSADVEVEFADKPELKDAWLRGKGGGYTVQFGQFKLPFSIIERESAWTLPLAERGLLHDLLVKDLQVAGRRPGFVFSRRFGGSMHPALTLGAFQGSVLVDDSGGTRKIELISQQELAAQSAVARGDLEFGDFAFGVDYEYRIGSPAVLETQHYSTGGADLKLSTHVGRNTLRVWLEGVVGASWFEAAKKPDDGRAATFTAGRLIAAFGLGARGRRALYLEPYVMLGLLDPDTDVTDDLAWEETAGLNVGLGKRFRVGVEASLERVQRNFPESYAHGDDPERLALILQAGIVF